MTKSVLLLVLVLVNLSFEEEHSRGNYREKEEPSFKFRQDGYDFVHHIVEVDSFNKAIISDAHGVAYPCNRTNRAINISVTVNVNITNVFLLHAQVYKFMSNEYRYFPINLQFDYCKALKEDFFDFGAMRKCGNMDTNCKYVKGKTYRFCNWIPDVTKYPPYIPLGKYRIELAFQADVTRRVLVVSWYGSVVERKASLT